uniref:PHD and RING finger domain-containing protein 1 n=1 Tax=Clastoptera arizonana TaxID=38151 RepID=A0A1B6E1Q4_9HEMI
MSDDSDIENNRSKGAIRKRQIYHTISSDSSSASPIENPRRSRKQFRISYEDSSSDSNYIAIRGNKKISKVIKSSESDDLNSSDISTNSSSSTSSSPIKNSSSTESSISEPTDSNSSLEVNFIRLTRSANQTASLVRKKKQLVIQSDESSSDSSESIPKTTKRRFVPRVTSDADSSSSGETSSEIRPGAKKNVLRLSSEEDDTDSDNGIESDFDSQGAVGGINIRNDGNGSSSEDTQSDKCPICLLKFESQKLGTPELCDHTFCSECLQEWAKRNPSCPIDRQPFSLILVRQHVDGEVIDRIKIDNWPRFESLDVYIDLTSCQMCGLGDREDIMLLCDRCDLGYHMDCLNPPLTEVPEGNWYCPYCPDRDDVMNISRNSARVRGNITRIRTSYNYDGSGDDDSGDPNSDPLFRNFEIPTRIQITGNRARTGQSLENNDYQPSTSSGIESMEGGNNRHTNQRSVGQTGRRVRKRRNKRKSKFRTKLIQTDDGVIEVKLKRKSRRRKRRARKTRSNTLTTRSRLATKLGMCAPRIPRQTIPETFNRQEISSAPINHQRHQGGVPTLDIFGTREQLDYFSGSDHEEITGGEVGLLSRPRFAHTGQRLLNRKKIGEIFFSTARRRVVTLDNITPPACGDLISSILDSQTLWHSKKTEIVSKSDGSLSIKQPDQQKKTEKSLDVKKNKEVITTAPLYPGSGSNQRYNYTPSNNRGGGQRSSNMEANSHSPYTSSNYSPFGPSHSNLPRHQSSASFTPFRSNSPIRFRMTAPPRRPNIHNFPSSNDMTMKNRSMPSSDLRVQHHLTCTSPQSSPIQDEEIDIYSDIEQESQAPVSTDRSFGALEPPPEPPALLMGLGISDDTPSDEDNGLVIDDLPAPADIYDPEEPSVDSDTEIEEKDIDKDVKGKDLVANYSSNSPNTSDSPVNLTYPFVGPMPRPPSHQSSSSDDDEDCPNFSMYSAASMNLARREEHPPIPAVIEELDIPIPPPLDSTSEEEECNSAATDTSVHERSSYGEKEDLNKSEGILLPSVSEGNLGNIPVPDTIKEGDIPIPELHRSIEKDSSNEINEKKDKISEVEDECSTQGDILELEANIDAAAPDETEDISISSSQEEEREKVLNAGEKPDGLIDITDEEMSVYEENCDQKPKDDSNILHEQNCVPFESDDDDNSLVGGATSAVSAGTLNNSDNQQVISLPGLEGLETETISESEDVNFDELPEGDIPTSELYKEEDHLSSKKKKKKKTRKLTDIESDEANLLGLKGQLLDMLEFEEGEIIEDKPKQGYKKEKKGKSKIDSTEVNENIIINKEKSPPVEKELTDKKQKKKKDKTLPKDKNILISSENQIKDNKDKNVKTSGQCDDIAWKKLSKSTKDRNYRDGKEKDTLDKSKKPESDKYLKKDKRSKEKRKELERYDVRRMISEKPKRPRKDEFGRDLSPSKSRSRSLTPFRSRNRSPVRLRNRSKSRSRSWRSRSRSRGRKRSRSRKRLQSKERLRKSRSREKIRSRSRNRGISKSKEKLRSKSKDVLKKKRRSLSRPRKSRSLTLKDVGKGRSKSLSRSWTPSWSQSSFSRSRTPSVQKKSPRRRRSKSITRSRSKSWSERQNKNTRRGVQGDARRKNLTVIVSNKDALKKKDKKKTSKKSRDDKKKKRRRQSPAPSKEVFTSGDNILVSVNFKSNKGPEVVPATTPILRESSKRKQRDETDQSTSKKKKSTTTTPKKTPGSRKKNSRVSKINEAASQAKPVAFIDLDQSPFREQTLSPKEVIVLSDSDIENEKQRKDIQAEIDRLGESQAILVSQPESPVTSSFLMTSTGPKTPPEPHIKFSISSKPSQIRVLTNPLLDNEEDMREDENIESGMDEIVHKGPNTPPEPPPELNTPASPPTTPYDPFDPTKSRTPSPQPRNTNYDEPNLQTIILREDKPLESTTNLPNETDDHPRISEHRSQSPKNDTEELKTTPESAKINLTPKASDTSIIESSPKHVSPIPISTDTNKVLDDTLLKPIQKLLVGPNKLDVSAHKSPDKILTGQQGNKSQMITPKQLNPSSVKSVTPVKHQIQTTPKTSSVKHQLMTNTLLKQIPALAIPLLQAAPIYTPAMTLNPIKTSIRIQNGDPSDDMDIDPSSPYSPGSSEGDDLFDPPVATPPRPNKSVNKPTKSKNAFDALFGTPSKSKHSRHNGKTSNKSKSVKNKGGGKKEVGVKLDEEQLRILDELPSSAVEMQFLKKLNRQERVVEEVKLVLKPYYVKKHISKEDYKEILRRSVPKICHNKSGEINPMKIQSLIEAYVKKFRYKKKVSATLPGPQLSKPKVQKTMWS